MDTSPRLRPVHVAWCPYREHGCRWFTASTSEYDTECIREAHAAICHHGPDRTEEHVRVA